MRDNQVISGFQEHDRVINIIHNRIREMEKTIDKAYHVHMTHVMMWDALLGLFDKKGIVTRDEFNAALNELAERTKSAMEEEQKKKAAEPETKVTMTSDQPAIEVIK